MRGTPFILFVILFISGCVSNPLMNVTSDYNTSKDNTTGVQLSEITHCPETCDDGNSRTIDKCSKETSYICSNDIMASENYTKTLLPKINKATKTDAKYFIEKERKLTRFVQSTDKGDFRISIDALEYSIEDDVARDIYLKSIKETILMDKIYSQRKNFDELLEQRTYHFQGSGFYDYINHTTEHYVEYDSINSISENIFESVYGAVDISTSIINKEKEILEHSERMFFASIPFVYRISVKCAGDVVVHLDKSLEFYNEQVSNSLLREQEKSKLIGMYREARKDLLEKAQNIAEICE